MTEWARTVEAEAEWLARIRTTRWPPSLQFDAGRGRVPRVELAALPSARLVRASTFSNEPGERVE
jgi:hypothetical protein